LPAPWHLIAPNFKRDTIYHIARASQHAYCRWARPQCAPPRLPVFFGANACKSTILGAGSPAANNILQTLP
jgi:hypothetical protein